MIRADITISYGGVDLAALRSAQIEASLDLVGGAIDSGWATAAPRLLNWSASGSHLQKVSGGIRDSSQTTLEQHVLDKTRLSVTLTTAWGAQYSGEGYLTDYDVQASFGSAMSGAFSLTGAGALTLTE